LDTLIVPDAPVKLEPGVNEVPTNENPRASRSLVELENRQSFSSRRESTNINLKKEELADDDMSQFDEAEKDQKGNFDLECLLTLEPLVHPQATKKDPRSSSRMSTAIQDQADTTMFSPAPPKVHVFRKELFANLEACKLDKLDSDLPQNRLPGLV
jgi:hypothetical protein